VGHGGPPFPRLLSIFFFAARLQPTLGSSFQYAQRELFQPTVLSPPFLSPPVHIPPSLNNLLLHWFTRRVGPPDKAFFFYTCSRLSPPLVSSNPFFSSWFFFPLLCPFDLPFFSFPRVNCILIRALLCWLHVPDPGLWHYSPPNNFSSIPHRARPHPPCLNCRHSSPIVSSPHFQVEKNPFWIVAGSPRAGPDPRYFPSFPDSDSAPIEAATPVSSFTFPL